MIKKVLNVASIILIASTAFMWYHSSQVYIPKVLQGYAVKSNLVVFNDDPDIAITIFLNDSNNILKQKDSSTFTLSTPSGDNLRMLNLINVEVGRRQNYAGERFFPYHLKFDNFSSESNIFYHEAVLKIVNDRYTLEIEIGSFEFKVKNTKQLNLDIDQYYGVYNKTEYGDTLVGVVVGLTNKTSSIHHLSAVTGAMIRIDSDLITPITNVGNEDDVKKIIPNYNLMLNSNRGSFTIGAHQNVKIFIPISYNMVYYTTKIALELDTSDGQGTFYLPNMSLKASVAQLSNMTRLLARAVIK